MGSSSAVRSRGSRALPVSRSTGPPVYRSTRPPAHSTSSGSHFGAARTLVERLRMRASRAAYNSHVTRFHSGRPREHSAPPRRQCVDPRLQLAADRINSATSRTSLVTARTQIASPWRARHIARFSSPPPAVASSPPRVHSTTDRVPPRSDRSPSRQDRGALATPRHQSVTSRGTAVNYRRQSTFQHRRARRLWIRRAMPRSVSAHAGTPGVTHRRSPAPDCSKATHDRATRAPDDAKPANSCRESSTDRDACHKCCGNAAKDRSPASSDRSQ